MNKLATLIMLFSAQLVIGQNINGIVLNTENKQPIAFVNIGVPDKNIGTVSEIHGRFNINIDSTFNNDSILFSCIGYESKSVKVAELRLDSIVHIHLKEKAISLSEIIIKPKNFKQRILGVTTKSKIIKAGFTHCLLGHELGVLMKNKKTAHIKKVNFNIAHCTFDTIFYRLNIYTANKNRRFKNILKEPIYLNISKESFQNEIQLDIDTKNILVKGDFLVTLEHIKNTGEGHLYFCSSLSKKTYFKRTSQGKWSNVPVGIGINVLVEVEK